MDEELRRNWLPILAKHHSGEVPIPIAKDFLSKCQGDIPSAMDTWRRKASPHGGGFQDLAKNVEAARVTFHASD